ncbi:MAG TPA: winged helix-turn-helix domain-containing protein [Hyphomicrobiaceae bacterium]|nr:winged helix-turn-helix domain-containing protein [Hyphomicrobiaceae bacterium]
MIGPFRLDTDARVLFRDTAPLPLSQRAVVLLCVLVEHHGHLVSKNSLVQAAWDGRAVEESNLTVQIASLRRVLGEVPGGERWVETLPRHGYRFVGPAPIRERVQVSSREAPAVAPTPSAKPPVEKPSIVVLPFQNLSGNPTQDYFGEGFAEDITTALSRLKWLVVAARDSSDAASTTAADHQRLARDRGVRYVLNGSTRLAGDQLRVTCQVIDAENWQTILSRKFDRRLGDVFAVQDEITESLVAVIEPSLLDAEEMRARQRPLVRLDCWGLIARAVGLVHRFEREANLTAQGHLQRAIALDPSSARAQATLAWALYWAFHCSWVDNRAGCAEQAMAHAETALRLDPQEPWARAVYGFNLSSSGKHAAAIDELRRVLELQPSFALGRMLLGWALLRRGDFIAAIGETQRALLLSPGDRFTAVYQHAHGLALLAARRFEEALPFLRSAAATYVEYMGHVNGLISCCGHLGLVDEARHLIEFRRACLGREFTIAFARARLSAFAHCDVFLEGLAKAGVPD